MIEEFSRRVLSIRDRWIALFLFILAFSIRFEFRSAGLLHFDSVEYAILGGQTFKMLSLQYAHFPGHPGVILINAAFYGFLQLFGFDSEFTTIIVSVLFGAMAPPIIYYICIRLKLPRIYALYAGLIMIFFPLHWSLSEYIPTDVESLFFLLAALYFSLITGKRSMYLSAFLFMFSIAIKLENIFLLPFYISIYIINLFQSIKEKPKRITIAATVSIILLIQVTGLFFLYFPYFTGKLEVGDSIKVIFPQIEMLRFQLWNTFILMLNSFSLPGVILIILGIAALSIGRKYLEFSTYTRNILALILGLALLNILFSASIPLRDIDRYVLTGFSLLILFIPCGLMILGKIDKRIPPVILVILVLYMVYFTIPIISGRHNWAGQKEFAIKLKGLTGENAAIVALDEGIHINYYTNLTIIQPNINIVENMLKQNKSVYMISTIITYENGRDFIAEGRKQFDFKESGTFPNEDWHGRALNRYIFMETIYRISDKRD
ncbi:MAG TPA: hypothetical protein VIO58_01930 [Candidatus Methanoperedens sp.]